MFVIVFAHFWGKINKCRSTHENNCRTTLIRSNKCRATHFENMCRATHCQNKCSGAKTSVDLHIDVSRGRDLGSQTATVVFRCVFLPRGAEGDCRPGKAQMADSPGGTELRGSEYLHGVLHSTLGHIVHPFPLPLDATHPHCRWTSYLFQVHLGKTPPTTLVQKAVSWNFTMEWKRKK